jgi:hypothetical protein
MCFAVVYISGKFTGFRFHFGLFDVYSLRFEAREFNIPIVFSYLHTAAGTILPLALVYCMYIRKRVFAIILGLVILLNFGIDGSKSVLFMLFLCFLGYWFFKFEKIKLFVWAFVSISVLSLIEKCIIGTHATTALFTYRLLYLPSWIHYWYYDFFSAHELDYFRQGILRWFGATSPYKEAIYYMISDIYGSSLGSQANNGLFTDAYLNLGALGILLFPPVIVGLLRVLDACAKGLSEKLIILPIISVALVLISAGISIALLTGGVLILLLLLYSMPREDTFFEGAINIKS